MIRPVAPRGRAGITLTEILISILIMGIGLVSLATLFPLALLRLREANRLSRSALLAATATDEMRARNLLDAPSFWQTGFYPSPYGFYDPFLQDQPLPDPTVFFPPGGGEFGDAGGYVVPAGVYRGWGMDGQEHNRNGGPTPRSQPKISGGGLMVAFDPLWRQTVVNPATGLRLPPPAPGSGAFEARFASGVGYVRPDPDAQGPAAAWGLQRITPFPVNPPNNPPTTVNPFDDVVASIFSSVEDVVMQQDGDRNQGTGFGSPVVPDTSSTPAGAAYPTIQNDLSYTWMATVRRSEASNLGEYEGDIVILNNRPFAVDSITTPFGGTQPVVAGEPVFEAIFGYAGTLAPVNGVVPPVGADGYGNGDDRTVLVRWPATVPDPEIKVGSYIADVTYERFRALERSRFEPLNPLNVGFGGIPVGLTPYPAQRCFWYRVVRKAAPEPDPGFPRDAPNTSFRRIILKIDSPVQAKTLLRNTGDAARPVEPTHVNVALVSPYVVYVRHDVFTSK